jgi:hypothetical protein
VSVGAPMTLPDARVVVLVRQGCHLCDDALAIVSDVCTRTGATWASLDVDDDERLRAEFTDHVPVTFVDGAQFSLWFVDGQRLSAALA